MLSDDKDNEGFAGTTKKHYFFFFFNIVQRRKANLQVSGQNIVLLLLVFKNENYYQILNRKLDSNPKLTH